MPTHIFVWGYMYPQGTHLGAQAKIWGNTFCKSVIGVHTSMVSHLFHGNSLYQSSWKFWPAEFSPAWIRPAFAKVYNFIVRLRFICPFRQLNLLCRCGFITILRFMFFTTAKTCEYCFTPFQHGDVVWTTWWNMRLFVIGQHRWIICFRSVSVQVCISACALGAVRQIGICPIPKFRTEIGLLLSILSNYI